MLRSLFAYVMYSLNVANDQRVWTGQYLESIVYDAQALQNQ